MAEEAKRARLDELIASTVGMKEDSSPSPSNYFTCGQCQKIFWSESSLKHHSSLYHSEKAFVCEICGKAFRFRSNLAEHRSVHTSLKPYVCKFCGKSSRLKGNLTKHILKHHKKEQNAYIGKDDIIVRKGKKSVKDPAAVDFIEKSMIVLPSDPLPSAALQLYTMAQLVGNEGSSSPKFEEEENGGRESSAGSEHHNLSIADGTDATSSPELDMDMLPVEKIPAPRVMSNGSSTRCSVCMKHFRKPGALQLHMTLKHGCPPAESPQSHVVNSSPPPLQIGNHFLSNGHNNGGEEMIKEEPVEFASSNPSLLSSDLKELKEVLREIRSSTATLPNNAEKSHGAEKLESLLLSLDGRVGRLEKQVESSLTSLYSLVQLQSSMNTAFTKFRDDISGQLRSLQNLLLQQSGESKLA